LQILGVLDITETEGDAKAAEDQDRDLIDPGVVVLEDVLVTIRNE